jgi:tRNA(Arg) A34 adenosine deaminase TadA
MSQDQFMREAIRLAEAGMQSGQGGPFGCVIVRAGEIVGRGNNRVTSTNDPTAHAEVTAIRDACTRLKVLYYGNTRQDAADIGFDDDFIYRQMPLPPEKQAIKMSPLLRSEALVSFKGWAAKTDKVKY